MKRVLIIVLSCILFTSVVSPSFAQSMRQDVMTRPSRPSTSSASANLNTVGADARTANLQNRAANEIARRITALQELSKKVSSLRHISDTEKATLTSEIQKEIESLTSLQSKIKANTDPTTLKTDVQSIVTSYRIFALYIPQVRLLAAAESLDQIADNLLSIQTRLQTRLTELQTAGEDVASMQTLLSDMQFKLTDAKAQANAITAAVSPLTPEGYPGNKSVLQSSRTRLKTGMDDVKSAAADARQIMKQLKEAGKQNVGTGSATIIP